MLNWFREIYRFQIIGISPERFINIANRRRLHIFNLHCIDNGIFGFIAASEFYTLSDAAEKAGVKLEVTDSHGLLGSLKKHRHRVGFIMGFGIFCFLLWYLSLFVWSVDVVNLPDQYAAEAYQAIYDAGIRTGVLSSTINGELLQQELEQQLSDFDFIKITRMGCAAQLYFCPSAMQKKPVSDDAPCDIVASQGGEIVKVVAKSGTPMVQPGDVVYGGDVLISGLFEGQSGSIDMVHAEGEVTALVEETISASVDYKQTITEPTGRIVTINRMMAFGVEIPLFHSTPRGIYYRDYEEIPARLFGFELPLVLRREDWHELCYKEASFSPEACVEQANALLEEKMQKAGGVEVIAVHQSVNETPSGIRVTRYLTLLENITEERKLLFD